MRTLSASLLAAQKQASRMPCVRVEARETVFGVTCLRWERLYSGTEAGGPHAATIPADGSLVRARLTPDDNNKMYLQRVEGPGPSSDFSQWTYTGQCPVTAVSLCSLGAEVSLFWVSADGSILHRQSNDCGQSWGEIESPGSGSASPVEGIAAAYRAGGDISLFYIEGSRLHINQRLGGEWQGWSYWDKSTGDLSGVAAVYDGDWKLIISGKDSAGNYLLWSLIYGDGGEVTAGTWSPLKIIASAPADGDFSYHSPFLVKPDVYRLFFVEQFSGTAGYQRPCRTDSVPGTGFLSSYWREPVPLEFPAVNGLAPAYHGDYCWLSAPDGVWRARLAPQCIDLSGDIVALKEELAADNGRLVVELRNDSGKYAAPGQGALTALDKGCELFFRPGYRSEAGEEVSAGLCFSLQAYEHACAGGRASLVLYARDGWDALEKWQARYQFRWNQDSEETCVRDILAAVLARVGLRLEVISQSEVAGGFAPDFTISPGDKGKEVVARLLSFLPDVLFLEGSTGYLLNPLDSDSAVYSYGGAHVILEGKYQRAGWERNHIQAEGFDALAGAPVVADSFAWGEIDRFDDRLEQVSDNNLKTLAQVQQRGDAILRKTGVGSGRGWLRVPVNCGQQMYDVIEITDSRAGLNAAGRRVIGLNLVYLPRKGEYEQKVFLGGV